MILKSAILLFEFHWILSLSLRTLCTSSNAATKKTSSSSTKWFKYPEFLTSTLPMEKLDESLEAPKILVDGFLSPQTDGLTGTEPKDGVRKPWNF